MLGQDRAFYRNIEKYSDGPIRPASVDLRLMDVAHLDFPDNEFDVAYSGVAFEHVADVPAAVRELWRVCKKPHSLLIVRIHLYASISGGHNQPQELATEGGPLPPWAHLEDERYLPSIHLNRLRLDDYLQHFGRHFDICEVAKKEEPGARALLTPEIEARLSAYSREDLLTQLLTIVGTPLPAERAPCRVDPVTAAAAS
jgi:SAM-dependent methyltransferase